MRDQHEFANNCEAMREAFACELGCGHQVGAEIPCYVHQSKRDTFQQCLVTDEVTSLCGASHPATTRLCGCS